MFNTLSSVLVLLNAKYYRHYHENIIPIDNVTNPKTLLENVLPFVHQSRKNKIFAEI